MIILSLRLDKDNTFIVESNKVISNNEPVLFNFKNEVGAESQYFNYRNASVDVPGDTINNYDLEETSIGFLLNPSFVEGDLGEKELTVKFTDIIRNNSEERKIKVFIADATKYSKEDVREANANIELYNLMRAQTSQEGGAGGSQDFLGLTDTPSDYSGQAFKLVKVNGTEDGLEFVTETAPATPSFNGLSDTPNSYSGQAGKVPVVNQAEDALEYEDKYPSLQELNFNASGWTGTVYYSKKSNDIVEMSILLTGIGTNHLVAFTMPEGYYNNTRETMLPISFIDNFGNTASGLLWIQADGQTRFTMSENPATGAPSVGDTIVGVPNYISQTLAVVVNSTLSIVDQNSSTINHTRLYQDGHSNFVNINSSGFSTVNTTMDASFYSNLESKGFVKTNGVFNNCYLIQDGEVDDKIGPMPYTIQTIDFNINTEQANTYTANADGFSLLFNIVIS